MFILNITKEATCISQQVTPKHYIMIIEEIYYILNITNPVHFFTQKNAPGFKNYLLLQKAAFCF